MLQQGQRCWAILARPGFSQEPLAQMILEVPSAWCSTARGLNRAETVAGCCPGAVTVQPQGQSHSPREAESRTVMGPRRALLRRGILLVGGCWGGSARISSRLPLSQHRVPLSPPWRAYGARRLAPPSPPDDVGEGLDPRRWSRLDAKPRLPAWMAPWPC